MTILYQWETRGEKPCSKCSQWNGRIFYTAESLPELPVHPNCECRVRAFDSLAEAATSAADHLAIVCRQSQDEATSFESFMLVKFLRKLYSDIQATIYGFQQIYQTAQIFLNNFEKMKSANTIGADKYFHSKANAEAAQLGKIGEQTAKFISDVRELTDSFKNKYIKGMTLKASIQDIRQDNKANEFGRNVGSRYPVGDIREFLDRYKIPGVDDEY